MKMIKLVSSLLATALLVTTVPVTTQAEVTYEEKDSGTNMGQSFTGSATVTFGQTPSFTIKIPKTITLDDTGAGKYTVGVKGQIPSKYTVSVVPDKTITMEEENGLLDDITADVTAGKTEWKAAELDPDSYVENTENTIQMQSIDYGKFEGTLNFNVSASIPIELKNASDEVKAANNYVGEYTATSFSSGIICLSDLTQDINIGDLFYLTNRLTVHGRDYYEIGYYKFVQVKYFTGIDIGSLEDRVSSVNNGKGVIINSSAANELGVYVEYLGKSYKV